MSIDGDGCTSLYNIMQIVHPALTEKKLDTRIHFQGIAISFNDHVSAISNYIEKEKIRGRRYSKYEGIHLALDLLNSRYRLPLSQKAEQEFKACHEEESHIHFSVPCLNSLPRCSVGQKNWD
jgi:hypothetical protein